MIECRIINRQGCGRKRLWTNLKYHPYGLPETQRKCVPLPVQDIYCVDQNFKRPFAHKRHDCHYQSQLAGSLCTIYAVHHGGAISHVIPTTAPLSILFV